MTSCSTLRVESLILSNSSMQHTPPSDRTKAPLHKAKSIEQSQFTTNNDAMLDWHAHLSRTSCFESGSRVM